MWFKLFASMKKSSLKCILIWAADVTEEDNFMTKNIGRIWVKELTIGAEIREKLIEFI